MSQMKKRKPKYIFVSGGVMSGVGKGVTTASLGTILQSKGFDVSLVKADPYLNVDAGTMNPTEHGEVFVMGSGLETDQDMGNYERFLNMSLPKENYMTNGMIFKYVIDKERSLGYKGACVEPTYHITEEILRRLKEVSKKSNPDIIVVEIGGTIGEYQNAIFLEAARQLRLKNRSDVMFVMVSYLPVPSTIGEMKTKPTQNAVRQLNSYGINPDIIVARSAGIVDKKRKEKIASMCGVLPQNVISAPDVSSIYDIPVNFEQDGIGNRILDHFNLEPKKRDLRHWKQFVSKFKNATGSVKIAIIGKYFETGEYVLSDSYISIIEALKISGAYKNIIPEIVWLSAKKFEQKSKLAQLDDFDGILVPGGFGETGIQGKINVIQYAREHNIPYFGICYGMQLLVVEYARNVLGWKHANTQEIDPQTKYPVIHIMPDQKEKLSRGDYGGSMRLGSYDAILKKGTQAHAIYKKETVTERHRHRFEVNADFILDLEEKGLVFSGTSPDGTLMEIAELPKATHPFFVGVQFHPEFLARPLDPHLVFNAFLEASLNRKK